MFLLLCLSGDRAVAGVPDAVDVPDDTCIARITDVAGVPAGY